MLKCNKNILLKPKYGSPLNVLTFGTMLKLSTVHLALNYK